MPSYSQVFADTALRVPALFIMDEVLKLSCGFSSFRYTSFSTTKDPLLIEDDVNMDSIKIQNSENKSPWNLFENFTSSDSMLPDLDEEELNITYIPSIGKGLCCIIALISALLVFLLSWHRLVKVYTFLLSLALIIFSYQANMTTVKYVTATENSSRPSLLQSFLSLNSSALWEGGGNFLSLASNYVIQATVGLIFTALIPQCRQSAFKILIVLSFITPTFALLLPLPLDFKMSVPVFTALLPLGILNFLFFSNWINYGLIIVEGCLYARLVVNNHSLHFLIENEWKRLNVPNVLRTFWLLRTAQHLSMLLADHMMAHGDFQSLLSIDAEEGFVMFKEIMIHGCETFVALLGMTSIVSYMGHYIGVFFQTILLSEDDDERSMGTICAILFFVLAEQSGITVLEGEKRFVRLCRNFSFLFTAMLHYTHNMTNPVLMSLGASRNPVTHRHVRALLVSAILIGCPCLLISLLWSQYPFSTWLLAVSAFSVQVIVKTLVSLLIYSLFLFDAYRNNFWECLDDYVYYIRAFGNSVEFIFGIMLFFTGAWIYFFESGGSIRATMMCIHAYFNIWCEAKNGWSVFMKRRTAVNKINSLPEATQEELDKHSDVCAICFQDLITAKVTKCHHLFHSVCLRKWLYVQNSCPLCHETLYRSDHMASNDDDNEEPNQPPPRDEEPEMNEEINALTEESNLNEESSNAEEPSVPQDEANSEQINQAPQTNEM